MQDADIRKYAELMKELGLTGLEVTEGSDVVRLERCIPAPEQCVPSAAVPVPTPQVLDAPKDFICVRSPMVGVFYASPMENGAPYVSVGEPVKKGQTLCVIEAMKLMNEISAEENGVISEICVTDGQVVEYGTELFRIKR